MNEYLQVGKEAIVLAKKTGSTDNLTGHLGTAKSTDCLIKEVNVHNFSILWNSLNSLV